MGKNIVVFVTAPNASLAQKLALALLKQKLAACVNIIEKVKSMYCWQGAIQEDTEVLLIIKTRENRFKSLTTCVKKNHSYSVPEIIALPIAQGEENYLNWLEQSLKK